MTRCALTFFFGLAIVCGAAGSAHAAAKRTALVVGTSNYTDAAWSQLPNAALDAEKLAQVLEARFDFTVTRLIDSDDETFKHTLSALANAAGQDDDLLVFVAGHGHFDPTDNAGYLVFRDGNAKCRSGCYPLDNIKRALYATKARHVLVMLDACYAGVFNAAVAFGGMPLPARGTPMPSHLRQLLREQAAARSRLVFTAVGKAPTLDGTTGLSHSPFMRLLLSELERATSLGYTSIDRIALAMKEGSEPLPVVGPTSFPAALPHDVTGTFLFVPSGDFCAELTRVVGVARTASPAAGAQPPWGEVTRLDAPLSGASECLREHFITDSKELIRCRFGSFDEAHIAEQRTALERRVGLCQTPSDTPTSVESACHDGACTLSLRVDLMTRRP